VAQIRQRDGTYVDNKLNRFKFISVTNGSEREPQAVLELEQRIKVRGLTYVVG
jgi:hypothetical protein